MSWKKTSILILAFLFSFYVRAQDNANLNVTYFSEQPLGWKYELIPFPLGFAPEINFKGNEELLFSPGMYKKEQDDYFSYVFVWQVEGRDALSLTEIEQSFTQYYFGLQKAVSENKLTQEVSVRFKGNNVKSHGEILWVEPFVTAKPQKLNVVVTQTICALSQEIQIYAQVSPQKSSHPIWKKMSKIDVNSC